MPHATCTEVLILCTDPSWHASCDGRCDGRGHAFWHMCCSGRRKAFRCASPCNPATLQPCNLDVLRSMHRRYTRSKTTANIRIYRRAGQQAGVARGQQDGPCVMEADAPFAVLWNSCFSRRLCRCGVAMHAWLRPAPRLPLCCRAPGPSTAQQTDSGATACHPALLPWHHVHMHAVARGRGQSKCTHARSAAVEHACAWRSL